MIALPLIGYALLGASLAYHATTLACSLRWKRHSREIESIARSGLTTWPGVTIFKALCGADPEHEENLRSFCELDYPSYQVIFGALDPNDPGLEAAYRLQSIYPGLDIKLVAGGPIRGENRKVSTLLAMEPHARHEIFVFADSDMRVAPTYLKSVVVPFGLPQVGLVTCPYRGFGPRGLPSILEALGIGAEFIPSAFLAYFAFSVRMAFGSTIALRRDLLEQTGGLEGLADLLADDYALADRVRRAGRGVHLSSVVVDDTLGRESMGNVWRRRLRWARTSRSLRPGPYWGLFITYTTPLALLSILLSGPTFGSLSTAAGSVCVRTAIALAIARFATADSALIRWGFLTPFSDLFGMAVWIASLTSRSVHWRGQSFIVRRDGSLERRETT